MRVVKELRSELFQSASNLVAAEAPLQQKLQGHANGAANVHFAEPLFLVVSQQEWDFAKNVLELSHLQQHVGHAGETFLADKLVAIVIHCFFEHAKAISTVATGAVSYTHLTLPTTPYV